MKTERMLVRLFEQGDFVRTPDGVGIVKRTKQEMDQQGCFIAQTVFVQHKFGISSNPGNRLVEVEFDTNQLLHLIDKEEYDAEED